MLLFSLLLLWLCSQPPELRPGPPQKQARPEDGSDGADQGGLPARGSTPPRKASQMRRLDDEALKRSRLHSNQLSGVLGALAGWEGKGVRNKRGACTKKALGLRRRQMEKARKNVWEVKNHQWTRRCLTAKSLSVVWQG